MILREAGVVMVITYGRKVVNDEIILESNETRAGNYLEWNEK